MQFALDSVAYTLLVHSTPSAGMMMLVVDVFAVVYTVNTVVLPSAIATDPSLVPGVITNPFTRARP